MSVNARWSSAGASWSVLVHGGAGDVPPERRAAHADGCRLAAEAGAARLKDGASALDAVVAAVMILEDDPRYNAGTGACLTSEGTIELDAGVMEGSTLAAGAVCAMPPFKNPIAIARAVLEDARHVLYAGEGAQAFACGAGFVPADASELVTEKSREALARALTTGKVEGWAGGTVGAVAKDRMGRVAAATSTGGMVGKRPGRVGDSPVLGAGTYADQRSGAVSSTGHGEGILKTALAARALFALATTGDPEAAAAAAIAHMQERLGSTGGLILVVPDGRLALARSTVTMSWAAVWDGGAEQGF